MAIFAFIGALSLSVVVFEFGSALTDGQWRSPDRLTVQTDTGDDPLPQASTWQALLINVLPSRFHPGKASTLPNVIELLRRAGYPYESTGAFYVSAIRDFTMFLVVGILVAGSLTTLDVGPFAPLFAVPFIIIGLRRPYSRLRKLAEKRAEAFRANMLLGLSAFSAFRDASVSVQDALRYTAKLGGPFCNLLGFLVARMEVESFEDAIDTAEAHLPDPDDVEAQLFFQDLLDHFIRSRPLNEGIKALRDTVRRQTVERTEERASIVKRRAGLFGVLAVMGLLVAFLLPAFMGGF